MASSLTKESKDALHTFNNLLNRLTSGSNSMFAQPHLLIVSELPLVCEVLEELDINAEDSKSHNAVSSLLQIPHYGCAQTATRF